MIKILTEHINQVTSLEKKVNDFLASQSGKEYELEWVIISETHIMVVIDYD